MDSKTMRTSKKAGVAKAAAAKKRPRRAAKAPATVQEILDGAEAAAAVTNTEIATLLAPPVSAEPLPVTAETGEIADFLPEGVEPAAFDDEPAFVPDREEHDEFAEFDDATAAPVEVLVPPEDARLSENPEQDAGVAEILTPPEAELPQEETPGPAEPASAVEAPAAEDAQEPTLKELLKALLQTQQEAVREMSALREEVAGVKKAVESLTFSAAMRDLRDHTVGFFRAGAGLVKETVLWGVDLAKAGFRKVGSLFVSWTGWVRAKVGGAWGWVRSVTVKVRDRVVAVFKATHHGDKPAVAAYIGPNAEGLAEPDVVRPDGVVNEAGTLVATGFTPDAHAEAVEAAAAVYERHAVKSEAAVAVAA